MSINKIVAKWILLSFGETIWQNCLFSERERKMILKSSRLKLAAGLVVLGLGLAKPPESRADFNSAFHPKTSPPVGVSPAIGPEPERTSFAIPPYQGLISSPGGQEISPQKPVKDDGSMDLLILDKTRHSRGGDGYGIYMPCVDLPGLKRNGEMVATGDSVLAISASHEYRKITGMAAESADENQCLNQSVISFDPDRSCSSGEVESRYKRSYPGLTADPVKLSGEPGSLLMGVIGLPLMGGLVMFFRRLSRAGCIENEE